MKHNFEPSIHYNNFGSYEPVLTIASGDSVTTSTADAFGNGRSGEPVAKRSNPLTGPFFIEDAELPV